MRSVVCLLRGLAVRAVPGHRGVAAGGRLGVGLSRGVRRRGGVVSVGAAQRTVTHQAPFCYTFKSELTSGD